ncbi:hypothetical protein GCK72_013209 [Caenorhabditis remanei]|uniref:Seven TM Receptor n=1 Tax=Caenorhabditis remanei TaxID=31234 RepID=A0A6A5GQF3_CAERE|nr:hypothetical protein GCK72_013209 [Caenorhabditis remanei]KAF1756755.1 hypothetical protein GCK72_013209 [Caenorhabditis remanei]
MFMMMKLHHLKHNPQVAFMFVTLLCGCYAVSITTISIQFVFRYFAMERKGRLSYFRGKYLVIWFLVPLIAGATWIIQDWVFLTPNPKMSEYISETVYTKYEVNVTEITYVGGLYYLPDENGVPQLDYKLLWGFLSFSVTMGTTFWTLIIFAVKSYKLVRELPKHGESEYTYKLQSQLFKALVVQASIPIIFLFIPIGVLFTAPLLHFDIEPASFLVTIFYSMYPAVDPLPIMLIVADYREGLSDVGYQKFRLDTKKTYTENIKKAVMGNEQSSRNKILNSGVENEELCRNLAGKRRNNVGSSYTDQQATSIS